ncbi:hypothetical protein Q4489_13870 [Thalassotalea sp. 1_MG-2023]|uniref:hypothetical protein n=1 Tax=Thalassotalea sp. 1_MG-2023 TaxID=3062680 RepID=UPI0026E2DC19|nr:hypothetical protein [Thalassotalea sp. 1_MG-2023]MDO6428103.1 hypothetical protein [Thalassotalea sp. 1_MG-2023]
MKCIDITQQYATTSEQWLTILLNTYCDAPSQGLAKTIVHYIEKVIISVDYLPETTSVCDYHTMHRFWSWQCRR